MGLFERLFGRKTDLKKSTAFQTLTAYSPVFRTWGGRLYESELVRSAIDARARHISKLKVDLKGSSNPKRARLMAAAPNEWQTWGQFLYRLSTILDMQNTAFIVPVLDRFGTMTGVFPVLPSACELAEYEGQVWLRYSFNNGKKGAIEYEQCGVMTKFQYCDDYFGEKNTALLPTMGVIDIQNQGITEGVKSAASYRFFAKMSNFAKPEDLKKERERFTRENFSGEGGGILLFPNTYSDITQISPKPFVVDAEQMQYIRTNVYNYFGVNEKILQNAAYGDEWSAFYEGCVEWFAIQFSEVMTKMLFTIRERNEGNEVVATANRLQYMSNADKLNVSAQMLDRGIMSLNDVREIWNLPPVEGGDVRIIRGEYYDANDKVKGESKDE